MSKCAACGHLVQSHGSKGDGTGACGEVGCPCTCTREQARTGLPPEFGVACPYCEAKPWHKCVSGKPGERGRIPLVTAHLERISAYRLGEDAWNEAVANVKAAMPEDLVTLAEKLPPDQNYALSVPCPVCMAPKGRKCMEVHPVSDRTFFLEQPHAQRVQAYQQEAKIMNEQRVPTWTVYDVACPFCGATAGKPCKNKLGHMLTASVHVERHDAYEDAVPPQARVIETGGYKMAGGIEKLTQHTNPPKPSDPKDDHAGTTEEERNRPRVIDSGKGGVSERTPVVHDPVMQDRIDALVFAEATARTLVHEIGVAEKRYAEANPERSKALGWLKRMQQETADMLDVLVHDAEEEA